MSVKSALIGGIAIVGMLSLPVVAAEPSPTSKMPPMEKNAVDNAGRVEAHIKELHDKLKITSEQESKWKDVADAMRKTSKEVHDKLIDRAEKDKTVAVTAVDQLKYYEALQQVQYEGAKRLIDPFEDLYKSMSAEQKKDADELFAQPHATSRAVGASGRHHMHTIKVE
jgi:hypothetical protein